MQEPNAHSVKFISRNPFLLRDLRDTPADVNDVEIPALLYMPQGRSRGAVVVLQGLGGPKIHRELAVAKRLAREGYVAMVPDSFAGRMIRFQSDTMRALRLTEAMMLADCFAALRYLAQRPDTDSSRIFVVGFSYGGMIAVLAAYRQLADLVLPAGPRFAGHASYYGCSIPRMDDPATTGAPVLMLLARRDGNVSLPRSEQIAGDLRKGGSDVRVSLFDAYHQWDGSDERKRHILFNLKSCRLRVGSDFEIRDERTGLRMAGPLSRILVLAMSADPRGYTVQRNVEARRESDRLLHEFLARCGAGPNAFAEREAQCSLPRRSAGERQ